MVGMMSAGSLMGARETKKTPALNEPCAARRDLQCQAGLAHPAGTCDGDEADLRLAYELVEGGRLAFASEQ